MLHKRSTAKTAQKLKKTDNDLKRPCPFCDVNNQIKDVVAETNTMIIARNRVSYDFFEGIPVKDHLMLIPRKHHTVLGTFSERERRGYLELLAEYESRGYSIYSRGMHNHERSVEHVHTHLLLLQGRRVRFFFFSLKPYLLISGKQAEGRKF